MVAAFAATSFAVQALIVAGLAAVALAVPLYAVTCAACQGCDEFWLTYFWICIPAN